MSHFAVIVVTKEYPTEEVLNKVLQPYHEYECTGIADEYVIHVDETEDVLSTYETDKTRFIIDLGGNKHSPYLEGEYHPRFLREATPEEIDTYSAFSSGNKVELVRGPLGYNRHVFEIPAGWQDVYLLSKENGVSLVDHAKYYYGVEEVVRINSTDTFDLEKHLHPESRFIVIDEDGNFLKYFNYTNPNKQWDWWQIGGRYTGRLSDGYDPEKDERNLEWRRNHQTGKDERVPKWPTSWVKFEGDIIQKGSLNMEKLMDNRRSLQNAAFDGYQYAIRNTGHDFRVWDEIDIENHEKKREFYSNQPSIKALREHDIWVEMEVIKLIRDNKREEFVKSTASTWIAPYAFVHEGKWYQKGEMGWFGVSRGDKAQMDWHDQFMGMFDSLENTDWLTVVDCHI
jgi:hypothetical protein